METTALDRPPRVQVHLSALRSAGAVMLVAGLLLPRAPALGFSCPFHSITGVPCPLCGLTRSVVATLHLQLHTALAVNPAGILAVVVAIALVVTRRRPAVAVPAWGAPAAVGFVWSLQLLRPFFN